MCSMWLAVQPAFLHRSRLPGSLEGERALMPQGLGLWPFSPLGLFVSLGKPSPQVARSSLALP